ncbi:hypothetical protein [Hymenobacter cellulosivorans]|uniref:Uncharacterized protein n=1 Tax=Hymenobacter cellulosivorans TaxID=2932249 RepID=A0ABY4F5X9_9BACT|nr:hypothetical protein [Hymenobacter cellulosivorans]UOQ51522.1 hypothetical protein MUN80_17350 [Hymenobacter cellulosivorans]
MSDESNNSVQHHWRANRLLGLNSISYGNDTVTLLNIFSSYDASKDVKTHYAFPLADTTIAGLEKYNDDLWTEIQLYTSQVTTKDLTISCGEGAMGNEGCIVATTNHNEVVWALFSTESNPFLRLELVDDVLMAYSDYVVYTINLANLTDITVKQSTPKWP